MRLRSSWHPLGSWLVIAQLADLGLVLTDKRDVVAQGSWRKWSNRAIAGIGGCLLRHAPRGLKQRRGDLGQLSRRDALSRGGLPHRGTRLDLRLHLSDGQLRELPQAPLRL